MDAARRANRFGWCGSGGPMKFPTPDRGAEMESPAAKELDLDDVQRGLARLLTIAEPIARLTPNKFDDLAVAFLRRLLAEPHRVAAAAR